MNTETTNEVHPQQWMEKKVQCGIDCVQNAQQRIESSVRDNPLQAIAVGAGVGYLLRSLPIFRIAASTVRLSINLIPPALLAIGAARTWEYFSDAKSTENSNGDGTIDFPKKGFQTNPKKHN